MLDVEINTKKLDRAFRLAPKVLKYELADGMDHIGRSFFKTFKQTRFAGGSGMKYYPRGLFTYFKRVHLVSSTIEGMGLEMFTTSKIAKIHEEGATLRNPSGGTLAVPLQARTEMFTARGKLKKRFRDISKIKNRARMEFKGKDYLVKVKKRTNEIKPLFVLKNKIKIKPRLGYFKTWDSMESKRIIYLNKSVDKALRKI